MFIHAATLLRSSSIRELLSPCSQSAARFRKLFGVWLLTPIPGRERGPALSCVAVLIGATPDSAVSCGRSSFWSNS
jgi:hypothetical protein